MVDDLLKLIERVEQATGPDRELDAEIAEATGWHLTYRRDGATDLIDRACWTSPDREIECSCPRVYSASLDAAMSLVPEGHIVMVANTGVDERTADLSRCSAIVGRAEDTATDYTSAATMPLALTAAALRSIASLRSEVNNG